MVDTLIQDLKYSLRLLAKSPAFTAITVLTLAIGIGVNTAIFSVVNAVLLRPLPYPRSEELVAVHTKGPMGEGGGPIGYRDYQDIATLKDALAGAATYRGGQYNMSGIGEPREFDVSQVTASLFTVLDVRPILGRVFTAAEEEEPVVVVSHRFWQNSLGADPAAIGRTMTLDGRGFQVIGVMPPTMRYPSVDMDAWLPIGWSFTANPGMRTTRMFRGYTGIVRLAPGITRERLDGDLGVIARRIDEEVQSSQAGASVQITSNGPRGGGGGPRPAAGAPRPGFQITTSFMTSDLRDEYVGDRTRAIVVLAGAVALVLLIACANTASLLIARATRGRKEIAVRRALGAERGRLIRQLLTESVMLSVAGAVAGIVLAMLALRATLATWPAVLPRQNDIHIDLTVFFFTIALSLLTGIGFGLVPALRMSSPRLEEELRDESGIGGGRRRRRTLSTLIVGEVALALVLLVGAGLMVRSFVALNSVDPGFDPHGVVGARIRLTPARYPTPESRAHFFDQLLANLRSRPGVTDATVARTLPLSGGNMVLAMDPRQVRADDPEQFLPIHTTVVGPGFFSTFGIPILQGRPLTAQDGVTNAAPTVVINQRLGERLWPGQDVLGKSLPLGGGGPGGRPPLTIIGVIGDIHGSSLADDVGPEMFMGLGSGVGNGQGPMWLAVRGPRPDDLAATIREAVHAVDAEQPVAEIASIDRMVADDQSARRLNTTLVTVFALIAAALAIVGIYGVTAYAVAQRRREFGVRMALGAEPSRLLQMVVRENLWLVLGGVLAGLIIAALASRVLTALLFGVASLDPVTFAGMALLLAVVALLATAVPARRAGEVDPVVALRND